MVPPPGAEVLPTGYKRVEYLECNNGSFIDTQITATSALEVICVSEIVERGTAIYGARDAANKNEHSLWNGCTTARWGTKQLDYTGDARYGRIKTQFRNTLYINDELIAQTNDTAWVSKYSFFLFAINTAGIVEYNAGKLRIYTFRVIDDGKIKNNLVPALDPIGRPCMYDLISHQPHYNAGAGEFLYPTES